LGTKLRIFIGLFIKFLVLLEKSITFAKNFYFKVWDARFKVWDVRTKVWDGDFKV